MGTVEFERFVLQHIVGICNPLAASLLGQFNQRFEPDVCWLSHFLLQCYCLAILEKRERSEFVVKVFV